MEELVTIENKELLEASQLVRQEIISHDESVKLLVGECINQPIWRTSQTLPHVTNETKNGQLYSVRFHNGVLTQDLQVKQTYATFDVGHSIIRVKGVVLAKLQEGVSCVPFVILVTKAETKRVLVNPETWFGNINTLDLANYATLREGEVD
jgi:hypothetical protein